MVTQLDVVVLVLRPERNEVGEKIRSTKVMQTQTNEWGGWGWGWGCGVCMYVCVREWEWEWGWVVVGAVE